MSAELDQISNDQLSEVFAVEVCESLKAVTPIRGEPRAYQDTRTGAYRSCDWRDHFTDFATDANAVLPWLEKAMPTIHCLVGGWEIQVFTKKAEGLWEASGYAKYAPTFARGACIALIRAKRATK